MAELIVYADVLTPDDPRMMAFRDGDTKMPPGTLLRDILKFADADWNTTVTLNEAFKADIRRVGALTHDHHLLGLAEKPMHEVSLDHVRDADPQTTWVRVGARLDHSDEDNRLLRDAAAS